MAGTRGDAAVWAFRGTGTEAVERTGGDAVTALQLRRQPQGPYDTLAEVWLDPAQQQLAVRVRWKAPPAPDIT